MPSLRLPMVAAAALLVLRPSPAQQSPDLSQYLFSDRAAEIALAKSAAPKNVSDSATILVLTKMGYSEAVQGTNGFTCMVQHSFDAKIGSANFWDPRLLGPVCFNPPAVRSILPEMLKRAEWIMGGVSPAEIADRTKKAYETNAFHGPDVGAMAFMQSPQQHLNNDANPHWVPHLMFYYSMSMSPALWGVGDPTNTLIDGSGLDPDMRARVVLVPVRKWSDGTLAVKATSN